ncbi:hypothetical protein [Nocardia lijiangensis]|uniref:hypothetical protein n=1 Tax=Nocardia lijiangensis TaxID=299618 RepID=UPI00082D5723|nr:hypothetical protein [Nocardia lijiangensis]
MVRSEVALRRLIRNTGKLVQAYGFHGADPIWVRIEPGGVASVGRTRTFRTWTEGQQVLRFGLWSSATPTAWWEFCNWRNARSSLPPTPLEQAIGPGLIADDGMSDDPAALWSIRIDPAQPGQQALQADVDAIRAELPRRVHTCARRALRLVESGRYLDELLADSDPRIGTWEAIAVLLADRGPGAQLDDAVARLRACPAEGDASDYAEDVIAYAQARAALV